MDRNEAGKVFRKARMEWLANLYLTTPAKE
jgi:hypothetical protein